VRPDQLVGLGYRLGGDPEKHGVTDCVGLCRAVLASYGIEAPAPTRDWYRRLRKGDYSIFPEQLGRWGDRVAQPRLEGTVALCRADNGYGLAVYWEAGWLIYRDNQVAWCPTEALPVEGFYYPQKLNFVTP
jgi:hypothetical protein